MTEEDYILEKEHDEATERMMEEDAAEFRSYFEDDFDPMPRD